MEGEVYADFVLFWLLCHESRVEGERPADCWLERWLHEAQQQGMRALELLRTGVECAIQALGSGFLAYTASPGNQALRDKLRSGELSTQDYYRQLLRLVYRLIVLFVAEDRDILPSRLRGDRTRTLSKLLFNTTPAPTRGATQWHPSCDLYYTLRLISEKLGDTNGCPELGLPASTAFFFRLKLQPISMAVSYQIPTCSTLYVRSPSQWTNSDDVPLTIKILAPKNSVASMSRYSNYIPICIWKRPPSN